MSLFSIIGVPEPKWASDFKNNVINPDPIPNPLVKKDQPVIAKGGSDIVNTIKGFFSGAETEIGKLFQDAEKVIVIGIVIFVIYLLGKK